MNEPWDEVADGVFRRRHESVDLNVGLIVGEAGAIVIDTRIHEAEAEELRESIRSVTSTPIAWAINTHWHWDHTFGNARFKDVPIVSHRRARERLAADADSAKADAANWMEGDILAAVQSAEVHLPTVVFEHDLEIDLGDKVVRMQYLGRGHTDNDILITVGEVLFGGDLIEESGPPVFGDGFPLDWPATLDRVLELDFGVAVPGHGDRVDREFIRRQRDQVAWVVETARKSASEGTDVRDIDYSGAPWPPGASAAAVQRATWQIAEGR